MTRGGSRPGSGQKPRADVPMTEMYRAACTPAEMWWAKHLATHARIPLAELVRREMAGAIERHRCAECGGAEGDER